MIFQTNQDNIGNYIFMVVIFPECNALICALALRHDKAHAERFSQRKLGV